MQTEEDKTNAHMLFIGDSKTSFKCDTIVARDDAGYGGKCGCNVFKKIGNLRYKCNGCNATYTGEVAAPPLTA